MTFCPEWITGSPNLDTSNVLDFWVYLVVRLPPVAPLLFHPLKCFRLPVHEHYLGPRSTLAHVGFIPRNCRVITFDSQNQIGLKMYHRP